MSCQVLTVSQLNNYIKSVMDGDVNLAGVFIEGEISNFKNHFSSGHLYFSLKDEDSVVKCVMFRGAASRLKFRPEDSMRVICYGKVTCYPRDGQYQLYVEDMQPVGIGSLALAYEQLKKKLAAEGLFDISSKRPISKNPKRIAVITSETGAAVQDIISVVSRRNAGVEIILCPVIVQGDLAAESMINALEKVYSVEGIDTIIIGRGGGSFEDLFCFNDENLIRKIYESPIPVISAVGHETDVTLCDLVADLRAPTPSAAAELAVPDIKEIAAKIEFLQGRLSQLVNLKLNLEFERLDKCISGYLFEKPQNIIDIKYEKLFSVLNRFNSSAKASYVVAENKFSKLLGTMEALNPASIMSRGYSVAKKDGAVITDSSHLNSGDRILLEFSNGAAVCNVLEVKGDS